jgi:hypothetical protein
VLVHVLLIVLANIGPFLKTEVPAATLYTEATGQPQWWAMFDAGAMVNSVAWEARIELPDGRVEIARGVARLPDDGAIWRAPSRRSRAFVYESAFLGIDLTAPYGRERELVQAATHDIQSQQDTYIAFLKCIYLQARLQHRDWPAEPNCVEWTVLTQGCVHPGGAYDSSPKVRYSCRWCPGEKQPLQYYDFDDPRGPFVPVQP